MQCYPSSCAWNKHTTQTRDPFIGFSRPWQEAGRVYVAGSLFSEAADWLSAARETVLHSLREMAAKMHPRMEGFVWSYMHLSSIPK